MFSCPVVSFTLVFDIPLTFITKGKQQRLIYTTRQISIMLQSLSLQLLFILLVVQAIGCFRKLRVQWFHWGHWPKWVWKNFQFDKNENLFDSFLTPRALRADLGALARNSLKKQTNKKNSQLYSGQFYFFECQLELGRGEAIVSGFCLFSWFASSEAISRNTWSTKMCWL